MPDTKLAELPVATSLDASRDFVVISRGQDPATAQSRKMSVALLSPGVPGGFVAPDPGAAQYSLTILHPVTGLTLSGVVSFRFQAPGMVNVELFDKNQVFIGRIEPDDQGLGTLTIDTSSLPNGAHTFTARAYDVLPGEIPTNSAQETVSVSITNGTGGGISYGLPPAILGSPYELKWADEFDTLSINIGTADPLAYGRKWHDRIWYEGGYSLAGQVAITNSVVEVLRTRDQQAAAIASWNPDTLQGSKWRWGYFEAKVRIFTRLDGVEAYLGGSEFHPALWLVSATAPDTADTGYASILNIFELFGNEPEDLVQTAQRNLGGGDGITAATNTGAYQAGPVGGVANRFDGVWRTYGMLWTPEKIEWWVDGVKGLTWDLPAGDWRTALNQDLSVILTVEDGLSGGGGSVTISDADTEFVVQMDYFRVYQKT